MKWEMDEPSIPKKNANRGNYLTFSQNDPEGVKFSLLCIWTLVPIFSCGFKLFTSGYMQIKVSTRILTVHDTFRHKAKGHTSSYTYSGLPIPILVTKQIYKIAKFNPRTLSNVLRDSQLRALCITYGSCAWKFRRFLTRVYALIYTVTI